MLFADELRIPEAQQVIMVLPLSFSIAKLFLSVSIKMFIAPLICSPPNSTLESTSNIITHSLTNPP
jgi:hypothetical protein